MDFFQICTRDVKGVLEIYPDFTIGRSKDLMVRGRAFYAIWDEAQGLWSTDEYDVQRLVDDALEAYANEQKANGISCNVKYLRSFNSNGWTQFRKFVGNVSDNSHLIDENLTFANTEVKKGDYVSRRLPYSLEPGEHSAWDELIGQLYSPEEKKKIEWAIGAVISGDSKKIQKFVVLYGPPGHGKGTVIDILLKLFEGYTTTFDAKELTKGNNTFATGKFKNNPLVAIQHDGDLSRIEDNTKLNSIISHEWMSINEKYKPEHDSKIGAFLFMGTNSPVKISDAKSGLIRRLIDVHPSGNLFPVNQYFALMARIDFELGAIAQHCLDVYRAMGKNYYNGYRPLEMMLQTDVFFNFIEANYDIFKAQNGVSLRQAYGLYKKYCEETGIEKPLPQYKVREELRNYFDEFKDRATVDGVTVRSYYAGFTAHPFKVPIDNDAKSFSLVMEETTSLLDAMFADCPAQYANAEGNPIKYWTDDERLINGVMKKPKPNQIVDTTLRDIDTSKLHYVAVPSNHIVIDFDLKDENGQKSLERNLAAASEWPPTYGEFSKSGRGVHLHYNYTGPDIQRLDPNYGTGIEVKVFSGHSSLRRALSRCNTVPVADINTGLPFKEKKVLEVDKIMSERGLRDLIARNLRKEIHPGTKPSIDFILKILDEAHESGMNYDVTDLRPRIIAFANNSTNQALACLKIVQRMKFKSDSIMPQVEQATKDDPLVFFDVEVYPNLFVVCWKYAGDDNVVRMINPTAQEIEPLFRFRLVGFNNRRYDNQMLYARFMGYDNAQLYDLSQKIMDKKTASALFGEAYGLSYTDIYDFSSKKISLKKFEIELGLHHMELDIPWDEPVDRSLWPKIVEYCVNDVVATEAVFEARKQDFVARQMLAELSGLTVNDTTANHTARIIFEGDRNPQRNFVYTRLAEEFPGYVYDRGKSVYRDEVTGEGGYVYAEPGMYENVALLDVASMHPTSIIRLNLFGDYTRNFEELVYARLAIKRGEYDSVRSLLGGKLGKFLGNADDSKALAYALKIIINIVYGLTSAKFDNPFRDIRNVDNIVAKRGALFMIDLKHFVQERGFTVAHIKTDSIKIPNATPEIIAEVVQFGEKYGYQFEHEATYDQFCLVNDAVYIAREGECVEGVHWTAVGAQFQHPYVFKTLFSKEDVTFDDLCETKQVSQGKMYLDFDAVAKPMFDYSGMHFVGRTGRFVPVKEGFGGGILYRVKDDKPYAVAGTKGYLWAEAEIGRNLPFEAIDMSYFEKLVDDARDTIDYYGSFNLFVK